MYSKEAKKNILDMILLDILTVSDLAYQERVWIRGEGPECDSYEDTICNFFPCIDDVLKNYVVFNIAESQREMLQLFRNEFKKFKSGPGLEYYLPENFIYSPEWLCIVKLAKLVLKEFNYPLET